MLKKQPEKSAEQLALIRQKEARELLHWQKEQQRPKTKGYVWYTLAILAMIYVVDEITALICTQMQPEIAAHLFDGKLSIAVTVPVLAATIFLVFRKIGDTTHVDLNTVRGDEWDDPR